MIVRSARDIGAAARDARLRRGWSQTQLADAIGATRQWVTMFENGKTTVELGLVLRALAALGIAVDTVPAPPATTGVDLDELLGEF